MNSPQPVFFLSNTDRKDDFLIETRIWNEDGNLQAEKRAGTEQAKAHLNRMVNNYQALSGIKELQKLASIVPPIEISAGSLRFQYIEGLSAERALLNILLAGDQEGVCQIIERLFSIVEALPSIKLNPAENKGYQAVFGQTYNAAQDCTNLGIIDLNFDNFIIEDNGSWQLYDYEWVFDFPIPKQFLRLRSLWYFLYRHREILRYHAQVVESVRVGSNLYIPTFLYNRYEKLFGSFKDFQKAESGFQFHVTGKVGKKLASEDIGLTINNATISSVGIQTFANKHAAKETEKIRQTLIEEREKRAAIERQLNDIVSSKRYRFVSKLAKVKNKLLP